MFIPPFCPERSCDAHYHRPDRRWWERRGCYHSHFSGVVPRYRCRICGRSFSEQTFSIDYYAKRRLSYARLLRELCSCSSIRALARNHEVDRKTVENKIMRLSRQALALQLQGLCRLELKENLVADGLQSFWVSQYFPNNLHVAVGADSQFVYGWDAVTIRRSGRMSAVQHRRREGLEYRFRADPQGIKRSFASLADLCCTLFAASTVRPLQLLTDEHQSYPPALASLVQWEELRQAGRVSHSRYSSLLPRTVTNPLFPVNYIDRERRKDLAEHVKESTRFARAAHTSMERYTAYLVYHNFFKPRRINAPVGERRTHAEVAGVSPGWLKTTHQWFFTRRAMLSHLQPTGPWVRIWLRMYETPLARHGPYLPRYLLG